MSVVSANDEAVLPQCKVLVQSIANEQLPWEHRSQSARHLADLGIQARWSTLPRGTITSAASLRFALADQVQLLHVLKSASVVPLQQNVLAALAEWGDEKSADFAAGKMSAWAPQPALQSAALFMLSIIGGGAAAAALVLAVFKLPEEPQSLAQLAQSRLRELLTGGDEDISDPSWRTGTDIAKEVFKCLTAQHVFEQIAEVPTQQKVSRWSHLLNLLVLVNVPLDPADWARILQQTAGNWPSWAWQVCEKQLELPTAKQPAPAIPRTAPQSPRKTKFPQIPNPIAVKGGNQAVVVQGTSNTVNSIYRSGLSGRLQAQFEIMESNLNLLEKVAQGGFVGNPRFQMITFPMHAILTKLARQLRPEFKQGFGCSFGWWGYHSQMSKPFGFHASPFRYDGLYRQLKMELRKHFGFASTPLLERVEKLERQLGTDTHKGIPGHYNQAEIPRRKAPQTQQNAEG